MAIQIVRPLSEIERQIIAPHLEAYRRFHAIVEAWSPEKGMRFDMDALCYYTETPDEPEGEA